MLGKTGSAAMKSSSSWKSLTIRFLVIGRRLVPNRRGAGVVVLALGLDAALLAWALDATAGRLVAPSLAADDGRAVTRPRGAGVVA